MMASVANPTVAARVGHASHLATAGWTRMAMARRLDVAKPASLAKVAAPVATAPAGHPAPHWWPAVARLATVARSVSTEPGGQE